MQCYNANVKTVYYSSEFTENDLNKNTTYDVQKLGQFFATKHTIC